MEQEEKNENKISETTSPPAKNNNNKVLFWILGGCLALLVIAGLIAAVFLYWGYKKVNQAASDNKRQIEERQNKMNSAQEVPQNVSQSIPAPAEAPAQPVSQSISEEPTADAGVPNDIIPPAVSEKAIGYLKKVYTKGGKNYIDIDYIQWLTGDAAEKAMREDGQCPKKGECIVYNDYYIRNVNPLIRTFEVAPEAEIMAHDFSADYSSGNWNESWTFARFSNYFNSNTKNEYWNSVPYHVEIGNNQVLKITEQYIP